MDILRVKILIEKMLRAFFTLFQRFRQPKVLLGRWGYHWEKKLVQTYYD